MTLEVHVVVLLHLRPTCREVTLEYESDGEVEEHVGEISDPDDPKELPSNQPIKNQSKTVAWQSTNQKQSKTAAWQSTNQCDFRSTLIAIGLDWIGLDYVRGGRKPEEQKVVLPVPEEEKH